MSIQSISKTDCLFLRNGWYEDHVVIQVMPDDHSEVEPLLPIPNRTVKRLCADDSDHSIVKVGHCQAIQKKTLAGFNAARVFYFLLS